MAETIETTWGQVSKILAKKSKLAAKRKVKLIIVRSKKQDTITLKEENKKTRPAKTLTKEKALKELNNWINSHPPIPHVVDDSRDSIYEEVIRDTR